MPKGSSITSVLLSVLRSHPEAQQLMVMVYSLLTIVCSQGASARWAGAGLAVLAAPGSWLGFRSVSLARPCFLSFPPMCWALARASRPSPFHVKPHCPSALLTPISQAPGLLRPLARQAGRPPGPRTLHTPHPLPGSRLCLLRDLGSEGTHTLSRRQG